MARSRHCDVCKEWHDLNEDWPRECIGHFKRLGESNKRSNGVIGDIEPYRNAINGKVIGGRKQHRDFLRAHGVVEVGNEKVEKRYEEAPGLKEDIRRSIQEVGGLN